MCFGVGEKMGLGFQHLLTDSNRVGFFPPQAKRRRHHWRCDTSSHGEAVRSGWDPTIGGDLFPRFKNVTIPSSGFQPQRTQFIDYRSERYLKLNVPS